MLGVISCAVLSLLIAPEGVFSTFLTSVDNVQWIGGSFEWPCMATKSIFKNSGNYVSKNVIATRAQIYKDEAFLVLPRFKKGVPVTLAKTNLRQKYCQATLQPFPCWSIQEEGKRNTLQNAVDLFLDAQDILWVLDVGMVNTLEDPKQYADPKVYAFNVKTGKLIQTVDLSSLVTSESRLQYLIVEYTPAGKAFIYISDAASRAIIVYDVTAESGFRVILPQAVLTGCQRRDVLYIALAKKCDGTSVLYLTYLSGTKVFAVRTDFLRKGLIDGRVQDIGNKPKPIVILGTDNGAALFFRYEGEGNVYRWDTNTCFSPNNFVLVYHGDTCLLPTHAIADYKRSRIRVLKSNFRDYVQGTIGCGAVQSLSIMEDIKE